MTYVIQVTENETVLMDWILTMHSWDPTLLDKLTGDYSRLRESVGMALVGVSDEIRIDDRWIDSILATIPVMFRIGGDEVGMSLKKKLWRARLNIAEAPPAALPKGVQEMFDASQD